MNITDATALNKEQIARAFGVPAHILVDRARPAAPRSWALLLTSENHGTVGPVGSTFPHAGEKHERVQVVEIVAAGSPPAPGVDLAGLIRFDFSDLDGENEQFGVVAGGAYLLAHEVEARCAGAAPSVEASETPQIDKDREATVGRALRAAQAWANEEYVCARNLGKGGPGTHEACAARQAECIAAIQALAAPVAAQAGQVAVPEGFALVPKTITEDMHRAAVRAIHRATGNDDCPPAVWSAMLAAAPASPAVAQQAPAQAAPLPAGHVRIADLPRIEITLRQAKELVSGFGGHDAEISVFQRPAEWVDMPDGLYAFFSDYPDEGSMYLGPTDVDDELAINGEQTELKPFDFHAHLARQAAWSENTFGPGPRTKGVCDHIRKELIEIEADPLDLREWIDVVILGLDGAWRCGGTPEQITAGIVAKQTKNEGRTWPDWRIADPDKAIEHDRTFDAAPSPAKESK